jgi:hypothetical protein
MRSPTKGALFDFREPPLVDLHLRGVLGEDFLSFDADDNPTTALSRRSAAMRVKGPHIALLPG